MKENLTIGNKIKIINSQWVGVKKLIGCIGEVIGVRGNEFLVNFGYKNYCIDKNDDYIKVQ